MVHNSVSKWGWSVIAFFAMTGCILFAQSVITPDIEMLTEPLQGIVLFSDGKTPVAELPVRLWNAKENKIIYRGNTDNNGIFRIPRLLMGGSILFVGRLRVDLKVIENSGSSIGQQHDMIVVAPRSILVTGGRMFDVLISPVLANALAISSGDRVGIREKKKEKPAKEEELPIVPPEPPVVSP